MIHGLPTIHQIDILTRADKLFGASRDTYCYTCKKLTAECPYRDRCGRHYGGQLTTVEIDLLKGDK